MKPDEPPLDPTLPTTRTTSGRVVYDPTRASRPAADPVAAASLRTVLDELSTDHGDARDAVPEPVELSPANDDGALISGEAQDAARAHVEAVVPRGAVPARLDSAPVKITDPRRAPTARIERLGPWAREGAAAREAAASEIAKEALPSSTALADVRRPASIARGARRPIGERSAWSAARWLAVPAGLAVLLTVGLTLRAWRAGAGQDAGSGSETSAPTGLPTGVSAALPGVGTSAPPVATSMPAASVASSSGDVPTTNIAPSTTPPPTARTTDPYDAGTPAATKTTPNAPPTVSPAISSAPTTAAPAVTTAPPSTSSSAPTTKTVPPSWIDKE